MKKTKLCFILVILIFSFSFLNVNLFSNKKVLAEGEANIISSLSEITDLSANYTMKRGQTYEYSTSLGAFSGTLNGNGATIIFTGNTNNVVPLFESLKGATVYNLCFKYAWCSKVYERDIAGYNNTQVNVSYDDCNPFGMIAGDFGEITSLSKHTSKTASDSTIVAFNSLSELFSTFMNNFEIPTNGTKYIPTISGNARNSYTPFYNKAIELYNSSLVSFTQNVGNDLTRSAVIGVNHPYTMAFGSDVSPELVDFQTVIANLFGFSSKTEFMNYAQNLANTYATHRNNIANSEATNEALDNGCFYTSNGSFVFPIAIKNELSSTVLAYVILDTSGLVSVWVNDITAALWATNFNNSYHTESIINNKLYCKNILFALTELTFDVTTQTSYGLLAGSSIGANVYGIELENINLVLNDNPSNTAVSTLNVGLLVGQASGGNINQIKINNCSILTYKDGETDDGIRANLNLGLLVGKIADGTKVQNNLITNSSAKIVIANSEAKSFNLGGIAGLMESGFLTNNIVDFYTNYQFEVSFARANNCLNFGYLVGKIETNLISIINNIVNVKQDSLLLLEDDNIYVGVMLGYMQADVGAEDIYGFLTTLNGKYVGNKTNQIFLEKYSNITAIDNEALINNNMANDNNWQNIYYWNYLNIWHNVGSYIPTLQIFEEYDISVSSIESVKSLSIENLPTLPNNEDIVNLKVSSNKIPYGERFTITASITTQNNFDKFFYITGLNLNGTKIYDIASDKSLEGYYVNNITDAGNNNEVKFEVTNINAGNMGTYSVQLARKTYKLKIKVYELMVDEHRFIPGKIKNNMASEAKEELTVDMQYGVKYTYETNDVNSDYAKEADWYLTYESFNPINEPEGQQEENAFDLESAKTSFTSKRSFSWTFDENCVLFGYNIAEDFNDYLNIDNYDYSSDDESYNIFACYVVFTRDVKDVEIRFKFDDDEEILDKIAEVLVDDGAVSLTYKNGVFTAKIRYGTKPHTITLRQLSTDYTFDGWYLNSRLTGVSGDEYAGSFEVLNDGDTDTMVLTAVFTKQAQKANGNLLWLWILLGVLLLVGIVIIVIVVKKKKTVTKTRKKYYY